MRKNRPTKIIWRF